MSTSSLILIYAAILGRIVPKAQKFWNLPERIGDLCGIQRDFMCLAPSNLRFWLTSRTSLVEGKKLPPNNDAFKTGGISDDLLTVTEIF